MVKNKLHTFTKMNKDIAEGKYPEGMFLNARNIRFITNEEVITGGFSFEKGNSLVVSMNKVTVKNKVIEYSGKQLVYENKEISDYYLSNGETEVTSAEQIAIGFTIARDNIILFTTDNLGFDCVWKINDETYEVELLYLRNMDFSTKFPIQALNNYENEIIDKVYWVDSVSQLRYINIFNSVENGDIENLIDIDVDLIQTTGKYKISQPEVIELNNGGIHTSGMIQYAYNLYRVNGSQTKLSPLSELISLDKGTDNGGGAVNEVVGSIPVVRIKDIDPSYTNIKLYAIKYTSYGQIPSISLIMDRNINASNYITYYDDGSIIQTISIEEFSFLGSDVIIPKHIQTKNNIMFLANYSEKNFDVNTDGKTGSIDLRAYSFSSNTTETKVYNSLELQEGVIVSQEDPLIITSSTINTGIPLIDKNNSSINENYDYYNKQYNSNVVGGEGPYIKYKIKRNKIGVDSFNEEESLGKFLKDNEIYRVSIQFYNKYGQNSLPKWIADFKTVVIGEESNLNEFYASFEIELKPLFYTWINDESNFLNEKGIYDDFLKPVGYKLLRAERTLADRTIVCQGIMNGMMSQLNGDQSNNSGPLGGPVPDDVKARVDAGVKIPSMMRRFDNYLNPMWKNDSYFRIDRPVDYHPEARTFPPNVENQYGKGSNEVMKSASQSGWTSGTYQFNNLMQMFSPEVTFNIVQNIGNANLFVVGGIDNSANALYGEIRNTESKNTEFLLKIKNAISFFDQKSINVINIGTPLEFNGWGWFGVARNGHMNFSQTYREYKGTFFKSNTNAYYEVFGVPEIAETGQGRKAYNNDNKLVYYNQLLQLATDTNVGSVHGPKYAISSVNSWGAKNITFALGKGNMEPIDRLSIEKLYDLTGINQPGVALIGEFRINKNSVYLGNIYGGNSSESKKRSNYIEVGEYKLIDENIYNCLHIGDTFINEFEFTKLVKTDTEVYEAGVQQVTEIVNVRLETTVDLKNRNDLSIGDWDNRFQPKYEEYQDYNKVYSQEANLLIRKDLDYRFKKVNSFDTNVISTKVKVAGELIDSWTDIQPNNVLTLDGKHGPINGLVSFRDELMTFQDKGIAKLSIQPRVQVQGSDGLSVELGTGTVLADYNYLTSNSGSINKWGILPTDTGVYYLDALNKTFNLIGSEGFKGLSDQEGFHKHFLDKVEIASIRNDNPIEGKGVSIGWDKVTNDVYLSIFNKEMGNDTLSFNLAQNGFSSFYDYNSSMYIYSKGKMRTIDPNLMSNMYENFIGNYNVFYGKNKLSSIDFILNPEPHVECTFNNLEYKSEAWNILKEEERYTWERIRSYNEFQDSGLIDLIQNKNIRKLNRKWRLNIPRDKNKLNRTRNTWSIIHLESNNLRALRYRNNDIISYYNPNYKSIQ